MFWRKKRPARVVETYVEPVEGAPKRFCPECGVPLLVVSTAKPFYDSTTGEPNYYGEDRRCATHGKVFFSLDGWY